MECYTFSAKRALTQHITYALFLLLILAKFREVQLWCSVNVYVYQETKAAFLLNRLCYPDNFNHSHQIIQSEKLLIIVA